MPPPYTRQDSIFRQTPGKELTNQPMTENHPSAPRTSQEMAQERTDYAYERTQMAATRTYFALLRTGLAIAAGGSLVTTILASGYPDWVIGLLSAVFIVVGYTIIIGVRRRHRARPNGLPSTKISKLCQFR